MNAGALAPEQLGATSKGPADRLGRGSVALQRALGLDELDIGLLGPTAGAAFLLGAGGLAAANAIEAMVVKRVGPAVLPGLFVLQALILLLALNYLQAARERGRHVESLNLAIIAAAILPLVARLAYAGGSTIAYLGAFVAIESVALVVGAALLGALETLTPGEATGRALRPVAGAGLLGAAAGSLLSARVAVWIGIDEVLPLAAGCAVLAGLVIQRARTKLPVRLDVVRAPKLGVPTPTAALASARRGTREALDLLRRSELLRFVLATAALSAALVPFIALPLHARANDVFATEVDLLSFYAVLKSSTIVLAVCVHGLAFGWVRRVGGVARVPLIEPSVIGFALVVGVGVGSGLGAAALVWCAARLGAIAFDEPMRLRLREVFPPEVHDRVDWLLDRNGHALGFLIGALALTAIALVGVADAIADATGALAGAWLLITIVLRARYARLVLATSLMTRIDFDHLRPSDLSQFLDRGAERQLEREVVSGVPARAHLALELLRQTGTPRLPQILAASYVRQPPALRPLFLQTILETLRTARPGEPGAVSALPIVARLARGRLSPTERAVLVRIYGASAARHGVDRRDVAELLDQVVADGGLPLRLAAAAARAKLDDRAGDPEFDQLLDRALASSDESEVHLAIGEIEELVRYDPERNRAIAHRLLTLLEPVGGRTARVRAHVISTLTRLRELVTNGDDASVVDARLVPLALDPDPRIAAASLDYLADRRFVDLIDTHVLPNLTAGNHHVRERARSVIQAFGPAAVPALLEVVRSGSRRERLAVSRLLGSYPVRRSIHRDLIRDEIRALARQTLLESILRQTSDPEPYRLLADRIQEQTHEHTRAVLRLIYADRGDPSLIRIERQLWSPDRTMRTAAIEALDDLARSARGTAKLRPLIDDAPLAERAALARDLVDDGPSSLDELMRQAAQDGNWVTRMIACHTIGRAGRADLADALAGAAASSRPALRLEANAALQRLAGRPATKEVLMTVVERMLLMKETELFRNLDARDLAGIAGVLREASFASGATIIQEGDRGDFLAIIVSGTVDVVKADGAGGQFHIRTMGRPEVVGEIALLEDGPRSASIVAKEPAQVALLSRSEFEALIEEYPGIALGIARVLSRRIVTLTAQAARR